MKKIRELTAFFNKQYRDQPDGNFLRQLQGAFIERLNHYYNGDFPAHMFYADDCFVVYRNLGFLSNRDFFDSIVEVNPDKVVLGRVWRLWVIAWSMCCRWTVSGGSYADFGTYNGQAFEIGVRFSIKQAGVPTHRFFAFDVFEDPPEEARKADHGPELYEKVSYRLNKLVNCKTVKGLLPGSLDEVSDLDAISWCQIDLNSAEADSATFKKILPKLLPGAMVIFDDYGFSRYSQTQVMIDALAKDVGSLVLELPTGQGLYIHPGTRAG